MTIKFLSSCKRLKNNSRLLRNIAPDCKKWWFIKRSHNFYMDQQHTINTFNENLPHSTCRSSLCPIVESLKANLATEILKNKSLENNSSYSNIVMIDYLLNFINIKLQSWISNLSSPPYYQRHLIQASY